MDSLKTIKGLFVIAIEEINSKPVLSWNGDILEFRNEGTSACLYITVNDEFLKVIEMHESFIYVTTTHRNKIPLYYRYIDNRHCISNSVYFLVKKNDNIGLDSVALASTLMGVGDPKSYFTNIFKDIRLLKSSSTYEIANGDIVYKKNYYSQYFNNSSYTNKNDLIDLLYNKYEYICKHYENINLFLSAGYDSRLELAFLINSIRKYKNKIRLYHYSDFGYDHDVVTSIANDYKFDLVLYNGDDLFERGVINFAVNKNILQYNSGPCQIGSYYTFEALNSIKENDNDVFLVNNVGALKGRCYPLIRSLKYHPLIRSALYVDSEKFERMKSILNISISYEDYLIERQYMLDDMINVLGRIEDIYAKSDILCAMALHSNLLGKRMHTLMMINNCAFPIDNDMVYLMFSNLKKEDKIGDSFIKYTIEKIEKRLNNYKYISGNQNQLRTDTLFIWNQRLIDYRQKFSNKTWYKRLIDYRQKFSNKTKNNSVYKPELILSMAKNNDIRSEILREIREHIIGETLTPTLYSLQIFEFLRILEKDYGCDFKLV